MLNSDWFATFEEVDGTKVLMENDGACSCKDTVQIKMNKGVVKILIDERYVYAQILKELDFIEHSKHF